VAENSAPLPLCAPQITHGYPPYFVGLTFKVTERKRQAKCKVVMYECLAITPQRGFESLERW